MSTYLSGKAEIPRKPMPAEGPRTDLVEFDGYARWSGTSFAVATVTGRLAALTTPGGSARDAMPELRRIAEGGDTTLRLFRM